MGVMLMNKVEKKMAKEKNRIESINAPEELEMRLRTALDQTPTKTTKRKIQIWKLTAVSVFFLVISSYHYNAFAFYGKKLFGFDEIITGSLKEVNEEGMGQIVDKKIMLEDGTYFIINGIITDVNQMVMFYTLTNPNGIDDHTFHHFRPTRITGAFTNSIAGSGTALINDENTEMKGTMSFESVNPFAKKLTLHYWQPSQNDRMIEGTVSFHYNPNKALQTKIKKSIKKKLSVDKGTITFNTITATPTMTVIEGVLNVENFDRVDFALGGIELRANGAPTQILGGGSQSSIKGTKFDIRYDGLPKQLEKLELVIKEFVGYEKLDEKFSLDKLDDQPFILKNKELWVKDVEITSQGVEITIATDEDVILDGVSVESQGEIYSLKTTVRQNHIKQENGRILKERTLIFDKKLEPDYILIEGIHYMKQYNQAIGIPID